MGKEVQSTRNVANFDRFSKSECYIISPMRRLIDWLLLVAVIGAGVFLAYQFPAQTRHLMRVAQTYISPCSTPITYSIGEVDPRFNLPRSTVIHNVQQAENLWEEPSGKDLFQYIEENGEITVRFVYDERQEATDKLAAIGIKIDESRATYDSLRARYDALSAKVEQEQAVYKEKLAEYHANEEAYNAEVERWNEAGGAPPAEYAKLNAEKAALRDQVATIKRMERQLNADIDTLNALATTLNQLIVHLNLNVEQYNRTGARGGEFEEGLYEVKKGITTISIFEFSNTTKLIRVLAHELGHALDLEHVEDEQAIMYEINKGSSLEPTEADLAELARVCRFE